MSIEHTRQRILKASIKEFSAYGFSGARIERIARSAKVNKAMIFYYFSSKKNLYQILIKESLEKLAPLIIDLISTQPSAEEFLEKFPNIYINFAAHNIDFVKMVAMELILNPKNIGAFFGSFFKERALQGFPIPSHIAELFEKWRDENQVFSDSPDHFLLNIISISLFSFLAQPLVVTLLQSNSKENNSSIINDDFIQQRIKSVVSLLKRGILK